MDGHFAGQNARDVVQKAIDWWRAYLDETELSAGALRLEALGLAEPGKPAQ